MNSFFKLVAIAVIGAAGAIGASDIAANAEPTGVIKERKDRMKAVGGATKGMFAMVKNEKPYDAAAAAGHAKAVQTAVKDIGPLFPEGSVSDESEALPTIWEDRAEFDKLMKQLNDSAAALEAAIAAAGESGDGVPEGVKAATFDMTKSCKACHKKFKQKKED